MNISDVKVRLTEEDILSIVEDFLNIDFIKIKKIKVRELIKVEGVFSKGIKVKFNLSLGFGSIKDNILKLKIFSIKFGILPISLGFTNFILKIVLKKFRDMGISIDKGTIFVDFSHLCPHIPLVDFVLKHITLFNGMVEVEIDKLTYCEDKKAITLEELKKKIKNKENDKDKVKEDTVTRENQKEDKYYKVRQDVVNIIPDKYRFLDNYIMLIPDIIALLYALMKDSRVSTKTKALISAAIGYIAMPYDVLNDSIPIIGKIDDLGVGFIILDKVIDSVPKDIIIEHWRGQEYIIDKVSQVKKALFNSIGKKNSITIFLGAILFIKKAGYKFRSKGK